jgi:hypothetical protein
VGEHADHAILIPPHQLLEGMRIVCRHAQHQPHVGVRLRVPVDRCLTDAHNSSLLKVGPLMMGATLKSTQSSLNGPTDAG